MMLSAPRRFQGRIYYHTLLRHCDKRDKPLIITSGDNKVARSVETYLYVIVL